MNTYGMRNHNTHIKASAKFDVVVDNKHIVYFNTVDAEWDDDWSLYLAEDGTIRSIAQAHLLKVARRMVKTMIENNPGNGLKDRKWKIVLGEVLHCRSLKLRQGQIGNIETITKEMLLASKLKDVMTEFEQMHKFMTEHCGENKEMKKFLSSKLSVISEFKTIREKFGI